MPPLFYLVLLLLCIVLSNRVYAAPMTSPLIRDMNPLIANALVHQFRQVFPLNDPWSELLLLLHPSVPALPRHTIHFVQSALLLEFSGELAIKAVDKQCDAYGRSIEKTQSRLAGREETRNLLPPRWWTKEEAGALCRQLAPTPLVDGKRRATFNSLPKMGGSIPPKDGTV